MLRALSRNAVLVGLILAVGCSSDDDDDDGASSGGGSGGGDRCTQVSDKLKSCELLAEDSGNGACHSDYASDCEVACITEATCNELVAYRCDGVDPGGITQCMDDCAPVAFDCGDDSGTYGIAQICDGFESCENGADEAECFACEAGYSVANDFLCDGYADCFGGEDEVGCEAAPEPITILCESSGSGGTGGTGGTPPSTLPIPEEPYVVCEHVSQKLVDCGLLSEGLIGCTAASTACVDDCVAESSCEELSDFLCASGGPTLTACLEACPIPYYECDGTFTFAGSSLCDGQASCTDGADEPATCEAFTCESGEEIPRAWVCDGLYADCSDSSDELDCATGVCPE